MLHVETLLQDTRKHDTNTHMHVHAHVNIACHCVPSRRLCVATS